MSSSPVPRALRWLLPCAVVLFAAAASAPAASAQSSGCSSQSTGGTVTRSLGSRTYELHVPAGLGASPAPLLLSLHGFGSTGRQDELFTGWSGFADSHGFIAAYPNGRPNLQTGAWDPYTPSSPDVGFLRDVVADISAGWCVDPARVYVDGWSNGAVMSQRTACSAADLFAAASSYAGGTPTLGGGAAPCAPSRPIPVALVVGQFDFTYPALEQNAAEWRGYDGCSSTPVSSSDTYGTTKKYPCAGGAELLTRVVKNTSHNWPSGAQGEDQRQRIWSFFMAHPLN